MSSLGQVCELEGHSEAVWCVAWSPDGTLLASCSSDKTVRVWGVGGSGTWSSQASCVAVLDGALRTVRSVTWSPCGTYLAAVSFDGTCIIWSKITDGVEISFDLLVTLEGHENEVKCVAWNSEGDLLATCGRDKSVWIWEVTDEQEYECVTVLHGHSQDVKYLAWHPTDRTLFSASYDDSIKVWTEDYDDWYCSETLTGHGSTVWSIAVEESGGGNRMASVGDDCSLVVWRRGDGAGGGCGGSSSNNSSSRRGSSSGDGGKENKWRAACALQGSHKRCVYSVSWAGGAAAPPDEEGQADRATIATGAGDNCIRVFREADGSSPQSESPSFLLDVEVKEAHQGDVNCVAWRRAPAESNDSGPGLRLLASAGDDEKVRIWNFTPPERV